MNKIQEKITVDVKFNEIDLYGVMWNGNYLSYFEYARQKIFEKHGLSHQTLMEMNCLLPLTHVEINFKKAIKYSDKQVTIIISLLDSYVPKLKFTYEIYSVDLKQLFCTGITQHVVVNKNWDLYINYPESLLNWRKRIFCKS